MIGRVDRLDMRPAIDHWKAKGVDLSAHPVPGRRRSRASAIYNCERQDHHLDKALDNELIAEAAARAGSRRAGAHPARRSATSTAPSAPCCRARWRRRYGHAGLPDDTISIALHGTAGGSFGAFLARGVTLNLTGDANDYVGKGLSGGRVVVRQPATAKRDPMENIIVGNTVLYGAIAGEAYFEGVAGERFAVRNSGAVAVVEGCGDHGCEYMTGGVVVVLGETGRNFAAGMSGGIAYVYDEQARFEKLCNLAGVDLEPIAPPEIGLVDAPGRPRQRAVSVEDSGMGDPLRFDAERLRILVERHLLYTGSARARELLDDWDNALSRFVKVMPRDYRRALLDLRAEQTAARTRGGVDSDRAAAPASWPGEAGHPRLRCRGTGDGGWPASPGHDGCTKPATCAAKVGDHDGQAHRIS